MHYMESACNIQSELRKLKASESDLSQKEVRFMEALLISPQLVPKTVKKFYEKVKSLPGTLSSRQLQMGMSGIDTVCMAATWSSL